MPMAQVVFKRLYGVYEGLRRATGNQKYKIISSINILLTTRLFTPRVRYRYTEPKVYRLGGSNEKHIIDSIYCFNFSA